MGFKPSLDYLGTYKLPYPTASITPSLLCDQNSRARPYMSGVRPSMGENVGYTAPHLAEHLGISCHETYGTDVPNVHCQNVCDADPFVIS